MAKKCIRTAIYHKYNGHCAYCGSGIDKDSFNVDHITPLKKDGTNDIENLNPSCRSCNSWKSVYTIDQFREIISGQYNTLKRNSAGFQLAIRFGRICHSINPVIFYFEKVEEAHGE